MDSDKSNLGSLDTEILVFIFTCIISYLHNIKIKTSCIKKNGSWPKMQAQL